jgi:hypothetical protein
MLRLRCLRATLSRLGVALAFPALIGACALNKDEDAHPIDETVRKCFLDPSNNLIAVRDLPQLRGEISARLKACLIASVSRENANPEDLPDALRRLGFNCHEAQLSEKRSSVQDCELTHTERMYSIYHDTYGDTLWWVMARIGPRGIVALRVRETELPQARGCKCSL